MTGVAGVIAYCGALVAYGVVRREEGDFLGECESVSLCCYIPGTEYDICTI